MSGKYNQKLLDHAKQSTTDAFKTASKRAIQKRAEENGDFVGNKIDEKITKASKNLQHNNSEMVTIENDKETPNKIHKERYMSPEKRQETIDKLRFIKKSQKFKKIHNKIIQRKLQMIITNNKFVRQ